MTKKEKLKQIEKKAKKFKKLNDFMKSVYVDNWIDKLAFGYESGIQNINPKLIKIKYLDDWENAVPFEEKKSKFPPIDVSYEKDKLYLEDGHHRLKTALKQKMKQIKMDLTIKQSPLLKLGITDKDLIKIWQKVNVL